MTTKFEKSGTHGGYSVTTTAKGWVVETWSRQLGSVTGTKILVRFSALKGAQKSLEQKWNEDTSIAEAICSIALGEIETPRGSVRTLVKGFIVQ
jgi:hypothetical protein